MTTRKFKVLFLCTHNTARINHHQRTVPLGKSKDIHSLTGKKLVHMDAVNNAFEIERQARALLVQLDWDLDDLHIEVIGQRLDAIRSPGGFSPARQPPTA